MPSCLMEKSHRAESWFSKFWRPLKINGRQTSLFKLLLSEHPPSVLPILMLRAELESARHQRTMSLILLFRNGPSIKSNKSRDGRPHVVSTVVVIQFLFFLFEVEVEKWSYMM